MPGTIQVSVVDFIGLSSRSMPSSIFIKVSMGKREYQAWDKGDFAFPLTTLRDNLILTLQDAEGNEISHTGVETMSIVEKGFWDDLFPLEGGGQVHMKLQFILSEEERNRIHIMRESAMKKKQREILSGSPRYSETASVGGGSVAYINLEVSDSQTSVTYNEAMSAGDVAGQADPLPTPDTLSKDSQPGNGNKEGTIQKQTIPNATDRTEETLSAPTSQGVELHLTKVNHGALLENIETQLPPADVPTRSIFRQEAASSVSGSSEPVVASENRPVSPKLEDNPADKPEKQGPLNKTPSNVKKMISALERSLTQGGRPPMKPPAAKSQSNIVGMESLLKDQDSKDVTKPADLSLGRPKHHFLKEIKPSQATRQLKDSSATKVQSKGADANMKNESKAAQKEMNTKESAKSPEDLTKLSTLETDTVSGRVHDRNMHSGGLQARNLQADQLDSGETLVIEGKEKEIFPNNSQEINLEGASNDNQKSGAYCEDGHYSYESSGKWIFPDNTRHFCITTGGEKIMGLFGCCLVEENTHQGKNSFSVPENGLKCGTDTGMKEVENKSDKFRKPRPERSADDASTGPIGRAIKIAIVVGFGILVLLTRRREPRKGNGKANDPPFATLDYVDEERLVEEWLD